MRHHKVEVCREAKVRASVRSRDHLAMKRAIAAVVCLVALVAEAKPQSVLQAEWRAIMAGALESASRGQPLVAREQMTKALEVSARIGIESIEYGVSLSHLGSVSQTLGLLDDADHYYQRALPVFAKPLPAYRYARQQTLFNQLSLYLECRLIAHSERVAAKVTAEFPGLLKVDATDAADAAKFLTYLASISYQKRDYESAEALFRRALGQWNRISGARGPGYASVLNQMALLEWKTNRNEPALRHLEQALEIHEQSPHSNRGGYARVLLNLGILRRETGLYWDAEAALLKARSLVQDLPGPGSALEAHVLEEYAVLLDQTDRKSEARKARKMAQSVRARTTPADLTRHTVDIRTLAGNSGTRR
jgi:tetratricopeptide (TPR) repeat protein